MTENKTLDAVAQSVLTTLPEVSDVLLISRLAKRLSNSDREQGLARDIAASAVHRVREALQRAWAVPFHAKPADERLALARLKEEWLLRYLRWNYERTGSFPPYRETQQECVRIFQSQVDDAKIKAARDLVSSESTPNSTTESHYQVLATLLDEVLAERALEEALLPPLDEATINAMIDTVADIVAEHEPDTRGEVSETAPEEPVETETAPEEPVTNEVEALPDPAEPWYTKYGFDEDTVKAKIEQGRRQQRKLSRDTADMFRLWLTQAKSGNPPSPPRKLRRALAGFDDPIVFAVVVWLTEPTTTPHEVAWSYEVLYDTRMDIVPVRIAAFELGPAFDSYQKLLASIHAEVQSAKAGEDDATSSLPPVVIGLATPEVESSADESQRARDIFTLQEEIIERAVERCFAGLAKSLRSAEVQEVRSKVEAVEKGMARVGNLLAKTASDDKLNKMQEHLSAKLEQVAAVGKGRSDEEGTVASAMVRTEEKIAALESRLADRDAAIELLTEQIVQRDEKLASLEAKLDRVLDILVEQAAPRRATDPTLMEILSYGHKVRVEPVEPMRR